MPPPVPTKPVPKPMVSPKNSEIAIPFTSSFSLSPAGSILPAGVGLYQKADTDEEGQKERKAAQYDIPCKKSHITPDRTHREDAYQHDKAPFEVYFPVLRIGVRRYRRAENIRRKRDRRCLIRAGLSGKGRAEHDQDRHHDRGRRKPCQPCSDPGSERRYDEPDPLHALTFLLKRLYLFLYLFPIDKNYVHDLNIDLLPDALDHIGLIFPIT